MRRKLFFSLAILLLCYSGQASNPRLQALLEAGQQHLQQQKFYEAEAYFTKVLELDIHNAEGHYYLAECKRHRFRYVEALSLYQAAQHLDAEAFPWIDYYLALMQKQTGDYRTAHRTFQDFIVRNESQTDEQTQMFVSQAQKEIQGIELVYQSTLQSTHHFSFQRLPAPVNSPFHDYAAQILHHDSSLVVSSARANTRGTAYDERYGEYLSDLLFFEKDQGQWKAQTSVNRLGKLNSNRSEGSGVFNQARDQFYFTGCYQDSTCRIMLSQLKDGKWSALLPLNDLINQSGYNTKHPALSASGDTLYFTSDRPGGFGQFDLWMSVQANGTWQTPTNLGPTINTSRNEVSPYYYANEHALLFASDGHISMGGYDLYVAYKIQQRRSETVVNLGYPFNSSSDELYLHPGGQQAFLTSNRDNKDGNFDLYTFRIRPDNIDVIASRRPENPADWYEVQFSSVSLFAPEDRTFFEQLPVADKVKVKRYITRQAFQEAVSYQITLADTMQYDYAELSSQEQTLVRRLARNKKQFLLQEPSEEGLSSVDWQYYESLSSSEKEKIAHLVDAHYFKLLLQEKTTLDDEAVYFYENLPVADQQKIERAIQDQRMFHQQALVQQPTLEDIFYYQSLPSEEKTEIERMVAAQQFMEKVWEAQPDEDMAYVYEQLNPAEQQQVKRYISRRSFQKAMMESAVLPEEAQQHYETLTPQEKESVRRLARAKKQFLMKEPMDETSLSDQQFYETLPAEEKELVTRIINTQVFALLEQDERADSDETLAFKKLSAEDQERVNRAITQRKEFHQRTFDQLPTVDEVFAYQALSDEEKTSVRRLADNRQFATRKPIATTLDQETKAYYEALPRSDQESVDRMVENRKKFLLRGEQTALLLEDQYFLETLTTKEKQQVKRIIEARVFDELMHEERQTSQLTFRYQNLYDQEKERVVRIVQTQQFFQRVAEEDTSTPPEYAYLKEIAERATERVNINGRLSSPTQGKFPARVFLVNDQNDTLATAPVDVAGNFTFTDIDYHETHRVAFDRSIRSFTQLPDCLLEELAITTSSETTQFGNIYFATNQHTLPKGASALLDSLVQFHRQHPEVAIEIRAFADSTGTKAYNLQLTRRRAQSVQRYLVAKGVNPHRLSQLAMGSTKGDELSMKGDELSSYRRAALATGHSPALPQLNQTIYIIQAQPDLQQIADRYRIPLEKLRVWNGEKEPIAPYTPIRVETQLMQ